MAEIQGDLYPYMLQGEIFNYTLSSNGAVEMHGKKVGFSTGWERTRQMLCIVDTSLSVLMTLRMCLRELCCFGMKIRSFHVK